jgi:hypothetical protein
MVTKIPATRDAALRVIVKAIDAVGQLAVRRTQLDGDGRAEVGGRRRRRDRGRSVYVQ